MVAWVDQNEEPLLATCTRIISNREECTGRTNIDVPVRVANHLNDLIADDELLVPSVVVGDFTPQVADWLGSALGKMVPVLGPRQFSETGSLDEVRKFHAMNADSIVGVLQKAFTK